MAKGGVTVFYAILMSYTAELYPTALRTRAYGVCLFSGRLAMCVMPFILGLARHSIINPQLILSCLMFISVPLTKT
jgi:hypothetical protein